MKKFIYLTVVLMVGFMLIGCRAIWPEQAAEHLKEEGFDSVGNSPFVGDTSPEARSLSRWTQMSGF